MKEWVFSYHIVLNDEGRWGLFQSDHDDASEPVYDVGRYTYPTLEFAVKQLLWRVKMEKAFGPWFKIDPF